MQMLLTGEPVSATQAVEWGLINMAAPAAELDDAVGELAGKILRFSAGTIEIGKQAYYAQAELPELAAYEIATPIMAVQRRECRCPGANGCLSRETRADLGRTFLSRFGHRGSWPRALGLRVASSPLPASAAP